MRSIDILPRLQAGEDVKGTSFGWWLARLSKKIDDLMQHRQGCIMQFADRAGNSDDHRRIWGKLDEQERRLTTLEAVRKG